MAPDVATYEPRDPSRTVLYQVIAAYLETFLPLLDDDPDAKGLPSYVRKLRDVARHQRTWRDTEPVMTFRISMGARYEQAVEAAGYRVC
jgi:hypothetical protein